MRKARKYSRDVWIPSLSVFKYPGDCNACQHASSSKLLGRHPSRRVNIRTGHVGATNQMIQNRCSTEGAPKSIMERPMRFPSRQRSFDPQDYRKDGALWLAAKHRRIW